MTSFLGILAGITVIAVLAVLLTGVIGMARGGEFNRRYGNTLMRWRVILQLLAVLLLALAFLAGGR